MRRGSDRSQSPPRRSRSPKSSSHSGSRDHDSRRSREYHRSSSPYSHSSRRSNARDSKDRRDVIQHHPEDRFQKRRTVEEEDVSGFNWGRQEEDDSGGAPDKMKEKPCFKPSGALDEAEAPTYKGRKLKWNEPIDASKPTKRWRLYIFKGSTSIDPYCLHRQSCYCLGRDRSVVDIPMDHPSCSKQHAVIQFRKFEVESSDGSHHIVNRPYLMDLGSANGSFINDKPVAPNVYVELRERDCLKFGHSTRDYVLLHEDSKA